MCFLTMFKHTLTFFYFLHFYLKQIFTICIKNIIINICIYSIKTGLDGLSEGGQ